jgi:AraC family L-rhamnose operon transcriptional activator RhaR
VRSQVFRPGDAINVVKEGPQGICQPHDHDFIEIVLTVGGRAVQETAVQRRPIRRGALTVLRPGHWHAYLQCRRLEIYNCHFGPELLRHELAWLMDDPKLTWLLWGTSESPPEFVLDSGAVERLRVLLDPMLSRRENDHGVRVAQLTLFLTTLSRELPAPPSTMAGKMQPAVLKTIRLVEGDLARPWTVRELAAACSCSPEYLIRLFRQAIGMTPYAYINRCRAERAAGLLLRTSASVAEIGEQVGWGEPCHFARRFRRQYGTPATRYRAQMRKNQGQAPRAHLEAPLRGSPRSPSAGAVL